MFQVNLEPGENAKIEISEAENGWIVTALARPPQPESAAHEPWEKPDAQQKLLEKMSGFFEQTRPGMIPVSRHVFPRTEVGRSQLMKHLAQLLWPNRGNLPPASPPEGV